MFKCKKCGFFDYELKEKPNGSGTATGLYCKTCGFWHKWIGKDELVRYKAGLYQGKPEPDTTAEIAALKAEIEWLRGEKTILERGIDIELKASRRSDHHMQQKIWLVNELLSQIQSEQSTTASKIKDILGSGTRENRSRPDLYADILEQKEMLLCEAAEAEAQAECERRNKDGNA